jgi:hypothetical protein
LIGIAVIAITAVYAVPLLPFELNPYDEGLVALGAEQVLKGSIPNVDFYVPYPPGVFTVLAALFALIGPSLLVERALAVFYVIACAGLGFLLVTRPRSAATARSGGEWVIAGLTATVAGVCMGVQWVTPVTGGALCLVLLSGLALRRALPSGHPASGLLVGALVGLSLLWRTDFGLCSLMACVLVWSLRAGHAWDPSQRRVVARRWGGAAAILIGAGLVAGPVFSMLVSLGGERTFLSLFVWPYVSTDQARLPWPRLIPQDIAQALAGRSPWEQAAAWLQTWPYYFPCAACAIGAWRLCRWRALTPSEIDTGLWLLCLTPGFLLYASGRTDYIHLLPLLLISLLFTALCLGGALSERPSRRSWRRAGWLLGGMPLGLVTLAALVPGPLVHWAAKRATPERFVMEIPAPRGAGILAPYRYSRQYGEVLPYLQRFVPAGERLYSGTWRHDLFMGNDVMLYFLAERDPGTYYWCLDAGVTTTSDVQQQMRQELSTRGVHWAVRWTAARHDRTGAGVPTLGASLLDDTLQAEFVTVSRFGWYDVLRRVGDNLVARAP